MQVAILNNKRIYADEALYEYGKNKTYNCPCCNEKVILKAGNVKIPYFSHLANSDCIDDYDNEMSEWHRYCQSLFPKEYREVIITKTYTELYPDDLNCIGDMTKETHIADICYKNYIIEFQHSPMDPDTFLKRTLFYTHAGYKLIWIFDWNDKYWKCHLNRYWDDGDISKYIVNYAPKTCLYYRPQEYKNNLMICFSFNTESSVPIDDEFDENILERIIWAKPDRYELDCANYSRIVTKYLGSIHDLAEYILSR